MYTFLEKTFFPDEEIFFNFFNSKRMLFRVTLTKNLFRRKQSLIHLANFSSKETLLVLTVHMLTMKTIMPSSDVQCNTKESPF